MFALTLLFIAVLSQVSSNAFPSDPSVCHDKPREEEAAIFNPFPEPSSCKRCFSETPSCQGKKIYHRSARTFTPVLEMGNWPSSEMVSSIFRILVEEILGFEVRSIVRSDYLNAYRRVSDGNITIATETWDQQMKKDVHFFSNVAHTVETKPMGMTGVEGIFLPGYVDETKLPYGNTYYSFKDVDELEQLVGPFRRAGTSSCEDLDIRIREGAHSSCAIEDFDCETLTYHGQTLEFAYNGDCVANHCDGEECHLNSYWALVLGMYACHEQCDNNRECNGFSFRRNVQRDRGLCRVYTSGDNTDHIVGLWQNSPHHNFDIDPNPSEIPSDNTTTCWLNMPNLNCDAESFDFPCSLYEPSWIGGTMCNHPEKSMWCPQLCAEDPSQCLEVMMVTPGWNHLLRTSAPGWFESLSMTLDFPSCFVYYGQKAFTKAFQERYERRENFFFWFYTPTKLLLQYSYITVDFPIYNDHCGLQDEKDPNLSKIYCSFEDQVLGKIIEGRVADMANSWEADNEFDAHMDYHDLYELWEKFFFSQPDYDWTLSKFDLDGGPNSSISAIACKFLKEHTERWCYWVQNTSAFDLAPIEWKLSGSWFWFLMILTCLNLIKTIFVTWFIYANKNNSLIKNASYTLSLMIIVGCFMVNGSALISISAPEAKYWCFVNQWLFHIGNAVIYSTLFCKVYRIHIIFEGSMYEKPFDIDNVSILKYIGYYLTLLNIYFFIFCINHYQDIPVEGWKDRQSAVVCWEKAPVMIDLLHIIGMLGFLGTLIAAFRARNSPSIYNESQIIFMLVCVSIVPRIVLSSFYLFDLDQSFTMRKVCQCINEIIPGASVVWFLFAHRIKLVYFSPNSAHTPQINDFRANSFVSRIVFHDEDTFSDSGQITIPTPMIASPPSCVPTGFPDLMNRANTAPERVHTPCRSITLSASGTLHPTTIVDTKSKPPYMLRTLPTLMKQDTFPEFKNARLSTQSVGTDMKRKSEGIISKRDPHENEVETEDHSDFRDSNAFQKEIEIPGWRTASRSFSGASTSTNMNNMTSTTTNSAKSSVVDSLVFAPFYSKQRSQSIHSNDLSRRYTNTTIPIQKTSSSPSHLPAEFENHLSKLVTFE